MRRRDFLTLVGATAAFPHRALAQQAQVKRLAFINVVAESDPVIPMFLARFNQGLVAQGWVEGKNLKIDVRFGANTPPVAAERAKELLDLTPDILVTVGNATIEAAKLTKTIPIVGALMGDPLGSGLIESLAHPGGNITGFTQIDPASGGKLVELLKELAPDVRRVGWLVTPPGDPAYLSAFQSTARALGVEPAVLNVGSAAEIAPAVAQFVAAPGGGLVTGVGGGGAVTLNNRSLILAEVARNRVPTVFGNTLNGAKAADLPVQQPTKMLLSVNLKTARAMGLTVPLSILARADQVIQ